MNINDVYTTDSKYLKAADLQGTVQRVKIASAEIETLGSDRKIVITFVGKEKGMALNVTNARTISEAFGNDTDNWIGGLIEVFSMKVEYQGKMVDGLRLRIPRQAQQQPPPARATMAPNARERAMQDHQAPHNPPAPTEAYDNGFDDPVPF